MQYLDHIKTEQHAVTQFYGKMPKPATNPLNMGQLVQLKGIILMISNKSWGSNTNRDTRAWLARTSL